MPGFYAGHPRLRIKGKRGWPRKRPAMTVWYTSNMKLGFEETQLPYTSGSQSARAWTERWVRSWGLLPELRVPNDKSIPE